MTHTHHQQDSTGRVPLTPKRAISTFGIGVVGFMTANLVPLMMIALTNELGVGTTEAGTIMTACLLATALTSLSTARWAAREQRKLVARIGLLITFAGFGAAAIIPVTGIAIAAIIIGGLGAGGAVASGGAALAALRNPNRASGFNGLTNRGLVTIVLALIPMFGIVMGSAFGILALLALAAFFTVSWLPDVSVKTSADPLTVPNRTVNPATATRGVTIAGMALLVCFALWAVGEDSLWAMAGTMGADQAGFSEQDLGFVLSASTAGGLVAAIGLIFVGSRGGRALPLGILLILGGALKVLAAFTSDPNLYTAIIIAWNTIYSITFMYIVATAAALDTLGRWSGPLLGTYLVGSSFSPIVGAFLADQFGYQALGIVLGGITFVLLAPLVYIARLSTRVEKAAAAQGSSHGSADANQIVASTA